MSLLRGCEMMEGVEHGKGSCAGWIGGQGINGCGIPAHAVTIRSCRCREPIGQQEVHRSQFWLTSQVMYGASIARSQVRDLSSAAMLQSVAHMRNERAIHREALNQPANELHLHSPEQGRKAGQILELEQAGHEKALLQGRMHNDTTVLLLLGGFVAALTVGMETLDKRRVFPQWIIRKVLHVGAVGACAVAPLLVQDVKPLITIVALVEVLLLWLVASGRLFRESSGRPGWGIALFPLPYLLLLVLFPGDDVRWLVALPMAILAISDAVAVFVGMSWRTRTYELTGDKKTAGGSLAFFVPTVALILFFPAPFAEWPLTVSLPLALIIGCLLTACEALGSSGRDNLYIPIGAAALLWHANTIEGAMQGPSMWMALILSAPFAAITVRRQWLTWGGAVAAALLGCSVVFIQGIEWLLPLLIFFGSSSVLGRILRHRSDATDAKHGRPRDAEQVFSNGTTYLAVAVLLSGPMAHWGMLVAMAVAMADTWASDIGMAARGVTIDLRNGERIAPGLSGGISLAGTIGALAASTLIAILAWAMLDDHAIAPWSVAAWGMAGMLLDSLIGAFLQARYRNRSGLHSDRSEEGAERVSGRSWMTNDRVNLLSNALIVILALLCGQAN